MTDKYELYIIYSDSNIEEILKTLYSYCLNKSQKYITIRKDYTRKDGQYFESNRKITFIKESLFNILKLNGLCKKTIYDFLISPYDIRNDNYPPNDSLPNLFFSFSSSNNEILDKKLNTLSNMKLINKEDWVINNKGIVILSDNITYQNKIKIKIMLDDYEDGFRVSWVKKHYI